MGEIIRCIGIFKVGSALKNRELAGRIKRVYPAGEFFYFNFIYMEFTFLCLFISLQSGKLI